MEEFFRRDIPLTIATVDMDWHWVDIKGKFGKSYKKGPIWGSGWTGYSWNTDLFPDYKGFLKKLHDMGLKVTLNLHPADGVRSFEDMYGDMAEAMGIDEKTEQTVAEARRIPSEALRTQGIMQDVLLQTVIPQTV